MNLPLGAALEVTGATLLDGDAAPAQVRVSTDTRTLLPGETFLALHGENFDGNAFAADAVRNGAALLVLDRPDARVEGVPTLLVSDTLRAYMALAGLARRRFRGRVLAITGSTGKTTCKAFVTQLLQVRYGDRVLAAPANENNEIGVSKLLMQASDEAHDVVVVEMGARHFGDIAALVAIAEPDVGILTNVGDAHVEIMGSFERLAETKWALFERGARAVLNARDAVSKNRAQTLAHAPHWFAAEDAPDAGTTTCGRFTALLEGRRLIDVAGGRRIFDAAVSVRVPGAHNRANAAAAIAGALELDVNVAAIADALPDLQLPPGRFESLAMNGGWRIIYDAYNASASGTIAALDALGTEESKRAIAVLGSMAELGAESARLHEAVGAHAAHRAGVLLVSGEYAESMARGAQREGLEPACVVRVRSNEDAARWLRRHARDGDVVLLKGSRKYRLEEILTELQF